MKVIGQTSVLMNATSFFRVFFFVSICILGLNECVAQTPFRIMCYNVENLFDCENDSLTFDDDFTPEGGYHWTPKKLKNKLSNIAKVITAVGEFTPPAIVGLCEIENDAVLKSLVTYSPLRQLSYKYIHYDSPDKRGIDVALLYQPKQFQPISSNPISVTFPSSPSSTTRDILYVCGVVLPADTVHIFVCHFPSRLGGELESEERRIDAATVLRKHVDSLQTSKISPSILIMGDFNDYPTNKSMEFVLQAKEPSTEIVATGLYNLFYGFHAKPNVGTHKHGAEWGVLDQMIVSGNLLLSNTSFYTESQHAHIYTAAFLLTDDERYFGKKVFRTFSGMRYLGGFADHLPIYADFFQR